MIIQVNKRWRYVPAMHWLHTLSLHIKKQRRYDKQRHFIRFTRFYGRHRAAGLQCGSLGVLYLITMINPSCKFRLEGNEAFMKMILRFKPRARMRQFADALNEEYPTSKPAQTLHGLRELYDRGIITVDGAVVSVVPEHNYVCGTE